MNSNDIKNNNLEKNLIICDNSKQLDSASDDDFDIYEIVPSDITPVNSALQQYIKSLGREVTNDPKGTVGDEYGNGDNRGNPYKRYKDILIMYSYIRDNLKLPEMKKVFDSIYKDVVKCMYSKDVGSDIGFEELMHIGLVPNILTDPDSCSGYIIHVYKKISGKSKQYKTNYGYIYIRRLSKTCTKQTCYSVIPFSNGKERSIGKKMSVPGLIKLFTDTYNKSFDKKSLLEIVQFTNNFFISKLDDPGFKLQFDIDRTIIDVQIQSLI